MRKGQLIKKVLKDYKYHIKYIQDNFQGSYFSELNKYLVRNHIGCGICNYISWKLPEYRGSGYSARWITKYFTSSTSDAWESYPICNSDNLSEVLRLLQVRVDIMERELQSGDKLQQRLDSKQYLVK